MVLVLGPLSEEEKTLARLAGMCRITMGHICFFVVDVVCQTTGFDGVIIEPEEFFGENQAPKILLVALSVYSRM